MSTESLMKAARPSRTRGARGHPFDEPPATEMLHFAARGEQPDWLTRGATLMVYRSETGQWMARDAVSRFEWMVDGVPGAGPAVVIGCGDDRLQGVVNVRRAVN